MSVVVDDDVDCVDDECVVDDDHDDVFDDNDSVIDDDVHDAEEEDIIQLITIIVST